MEKLARIKPLEKETKSSKLNLPLTILSESNSRLAKDENLGLDLEYLFNTKKMEEYLEAAGYQIPKLMIERSVFTFQSVPDDFQLPRKIHDIYEEKSFSEFQQILSRIQSPENSKPDMIHFKIDYKSIWRGIQAS
jgi:hypothetical protein